MNSKSFDDPKKLLDLLRKMAGQGGVDLSHFSHLLKRAGVPMRYGGPHHWKHGTIRPKKRQGSRRLNQQHIRRLQDNDVDVDTCPTGCDDIGDETERKICNCEILFDCAQQLKTSDYAFIFSQGLVDESGIIEANLEDNPALNDIYDARQLLQKKNTIQGLTLQGLTSLRDLPTTENSLLDTCDALLEQFHVPCKNSESDCSSSDGQSYRMVRGWGIVGSSFFRLDSSRLVLFVTAF